MNLFMRGLLLAVLMSVLVPCQAVFSTESEEDDRISVSIGILAKRGYERAVEQWRLTADYLTEKIPGYRFEAVPLDFREMIPAVVAGQVQFVIANPAIYVELEMEHGASRLVTLKNTDEDGNVQMRFGGAVFCLRQRQDIRTLEDLTGKRFAAVEENSFGGWLVAKRELKARGIDPHRHFRRLEFKGTHDEVVYAVLRAEADAGTVRTDTLERMASEGKIRLDDFRVIPYQALQTGDKTEIKKESAQETFLHSTRLYPEWPVAKLQHTSKHLSDQVAVALLQMPRDHPAAKSAKSAGWTVPLNYQSVHDCLKEVHYGPYGDFGQVDLKTVIKKYLPWVFSGVLLFISVTAGLAWALVANLKVQQAKRYVEQLLRVSPSAIFTVDQNQIVRSWNKKAEEITGYSADEVIGNPCTAFAETPCREKCGLFSDGALMPIRARECTLRTKDGRLRHIIKHADLLRDPKGRITGGIESFEDITRRKETEEELKATKEELEKRVAVRTRELSQKLEELERFRQATITREYRMEEMRKELERLKKKDETA